MTGSNDPKSHDSEVLEAYIERLLAMDHGSRPLGDDDLHRVARDLGLSDQDLAKIEQIAGDHLTRGRHFFQRGLFEEAAAELHQAHVLRPFDAAVATELARAHLGRFTRTQDSADRAQCERFARRAVELDPDHSPAYELLQKAKNSSRRSRPRRIAAIAGIAGIVLVAGAAGAVLWLTSSSAPDHSHPADDIVATADPGVTSEPDGPASQPVIEAQPPESEIPLALADPASQGFSLHTERSRLQRFQGASFSYSIDATITAGAEELRLVRARLELLSAKGEVLRKKHVTLHKDHEPAMRPGESAPVHLLHFEKTSAPAVESARLVVELTERAPAAASYAPDKEKALTWPDGQPAHIQVDMRERERQVKTLLDKSSLWLVLTITNRGRRPIEGLRCEVIAYASDGSVLARKLVYMVASTGPALPPGQTFAKRIIMELGPAGTEPARYDVRVVQAE